MNSKEELTAVLRALKTVRNRWFSLARLKAQEISSNCPELTSAQAFNQALIHGEVFREYEKLTNLLGVLGSNADAYLSVLEENPPESQVSNCIF